FGKPAWERGYGCLARALDGEPLSPLLTIDERTHDGLGAPFDALGFTRPDSVRLFVGGRPVEPLVSARSAREFDVPGNGASDWEHPQSLYVHGGDLPEDEVLEALGDGLWVSDLHYLNFSDHGAGSVTGLTRFACFRVEGGRIMGPIPVMRFDDSAFSLLGTSLERLTDTPRLHPETRSYDGRSSRSVRCPGALVGGLRLTL
ncbi:MAG: hypothetical protein KC656_31090, partial [Myxococcales bacterium]|nr:hypothetical protein [Myxococcales bacterium]